MIRKRRSFLAQHAEHSQALSPVLELLTQIGESISHRQRDGISRINQCCLREMRIALRGGYLRMPENLLHFIDRAPGIDQERGEGMAQIMNAHIGNLQTAVRSQLTQTPLSTKARGARGLI